MRNKIVLTVIFFVLFSTCKRREAENGAGNLRDLQQIISSGRLHVLMENSSSGFIHHNGKVTGYEYDLMHDFASSLGVKLNIIKIGDMDSVIYYLKHGKADIAAAGLTVTNERLKYVSFSNPYLFTRQVLVQKKPDGWESLSRSALTSAMVRDILALKGRAVTVRRNSSFYTRLKSFLDETGSQIKIISAPGNYSTEKLIEMVSEGQIEMTVADEHIAKLNSFYFPNIDIQTHISLKQKIAWALGKHSPELMKKLNAWLESDEVQLKLRLLERKYFEQKNHNLKGFKLPGTTEQMVKLYSQQFGWDWRLIVSIIKAESGGDHYARSWAGAMGIMQLMPETAARYGTDSAGTPAEHIRAGILYLSELDRLWRPHVKDARERIFFSIASYNSGPGHILDARNLALKYGANPNIWEGNVREWLIRKEDPAYYCDEVVKHGFSYGSVTARYVEEVVSTYYSMISKDQRAEKHLARVTQ